MTWKDISTLQPGLHCSEKTITRCWPGLLRQHERAAGRDAAQGIGRVEHGRRPPGGTGGGDRGPAAGVPAQAMVTCDGAGASHGLITRLDKLARRPGYQLTYSAENTGQLALGTRHRHSMGTHQRPRPRPLTSTPVPCPDDHTTPGPVEPRPPGPTAGPRSRPRHKIKITTAASAAVNDRRAGRMNHRG